MDVKNITLRISLALLMAIISFCKSDVSYAGCGKDINRGIQNIIDIDRVAYQIPGIEVSVSCSGENATRDFVSGTTMLHGNILVQDDNLFQIGSETKSFIATIILQLEAEGLLSTDDKIGKWLPHLIQSWKEITIKQLLNHTSGIYNYTDVLLEMIKNGDNLDLKKQWTDEELLNLVVKKPLYFEPGKGWHYSNTNYVLAGMVLEAVTGKSVTEEIKTKLTEPLRLLNTYYIPSLYSEEMIKHMAHGYANSGLFPDEPKDITETNSSWLNAAGAIVSTSHDIAIWFRALLSGSLLPTKQMNELMMLVDEKNGEPIPATRHADGYGLAVMHDFDTFGEESWWHSGGTLGYAALMVWLKCNDIVITINVNHLLSDIPSDRDSYLLTKDLISYIQKTSGSNRCYLTSRSDTRTRYESRNKNVLF